jgi:hypothetical protein
MFKNKVIVVFILLFCKTALPYQNKILLLSFPRSGNSWTTYCIENIANIKVLSSPSDHNQSSVITTTIDEKTSSKKTCGYKDHYPGQINYPIDGLITIVRDYKECTTKETSLYGNAKNMLIRSAAYTYSYMLVLDFFEKSSKPKLIIYYEDLINKPIKTINKICKFIQKFETFSKTKIDNFCTNLEFHQKKSLSMYGSSATNGNTDLMHHHSKKHLTQSERHQFDSIVSKHNPKLYNKYLIKYRELS